MELVLRLLSLLLLDRRVVVGDSLTSRRENCPSRYFSMRRRFRWREGVSAIWVELSRLMLLLG